MTPRERARFYSERNKKAAASRVRGAALRAAAAGDVGGHSIPETLEKLRTRLGGGA